MDGAGKLNGSGEVEIAALVAIGEAFVIQAEQVDEEQCKGSSHDL